MRIKTKLIQDGALACDERIDDKINKFIEENSIKVIDIKFTSSNDILKALIIYEGGSRYDK